jgi:hypothetical protein
MDNTKKIITIIGLGFELLSLVGIIVIIWFMNNFQSIPGLSSDLDLMTTEDIDALNEFLGFFVDVLYVALAVISCIVLLNIFLFSRLIGGRYTEAQAKKVYLYQAIWGGINLLSNQITGILYLISGVGGYNGQKEETDIRDGL